MGAAAPVTTVVALSSSNPAVAQVPASVTVPTGQFTATFTITTSAVSVTTTVTITASFNGSIENGHADGHSSGRAAAGPTVQRLVTSPDTVEGGTGSQGVVTLSGAAPAAGASVSLSSSNAGWRAFPRA